MKNVIKTLFTAFLVVSTAHYAFAAADGAEGTTSSGTADLTVTIPKLVKITGMANLSQTFNGVANFSQNQNVCVYSNMDTGSGEYTVRITGSANPKVTSPSAGFFVGNAGTDNELAYTVAWNDETGTSGQTAVTSGADLEDQTGFSNSTNCSGGTNANYHVTMTAAALSAVRPGNYTGTITILITPQ